ncbi:glycosyltransferase family 2 protein [Entomobacter blattae]|uniref:Uncharacterized protein n=1 Tax=Entomobacter blattae TaxID=2762277 RepID=A0A7H1NS69_9PROT|nr:glycosyltransferase family 2 protein [Entomobacter blattae]QNT78629.1 hypothetical protein JGUZn3_14040 [Entomobacter blattae]
MVTVRCIMMEKNEEVLLEPWILYHAHLFGFENLTILDNGSTNQRVQTLLNKYEKRGCHIIRSFTERQNFVDKGKIITEIIQEWDRSHEPYDFAVPLDCDEFLAFFDQKILMNRDDILAEFRHLKKYDGTFLLHRILMNDPVNMGLFYPQIIRKSFFKKNTLVGLDNGYHEPVTIYDDKMIWTGFVYIHLHNRYDFLELKRFSSEKLMPFIELLNGETLKNYTGIGSHLVADFFHTEEDYKYQYRDKGLLYGGEFIAKLQNLGCGLQEIFGQEAYSSQSYHNITQFYHQYNIQYHLISFKEKDSSTVEFYDEKFYRHNNPDVHDHSFFKIWPLVHFINYGYYEGRKGSGLTLQAFSSDVS